MENKTGKYLKYAIGEIVLVVIGILIALQINNWNEQQKHNRSRKTYTETLIKDLEKDSVQLINENNVLKDRLEKLAQIKQRLSSPFATMDTLNQIIRYEHNPSFVLNEPINRNTFSTLTSTGNLEFFEQKIAESIQNYYQNATFVENYHATQLDFYRNLFIEFLTNVPIAKTSLSSQSIILEQDELEEELWQETDIKKIHGIYRGQASLQLNMFAAFERTNTNLLKLNYELKEQLKKGM